MKRQLLFALCAISALQVASADSLQGKIEELCRETVTTTKPEKISIDRAVSILKDEGYAVKKAGENRVIIKVNGTKFALFRYKDGDYQMFYGASGVNVSYKDINDWNRRKRLSKAYLDKDNDPALEFDLESGAGITPKQLLQFVHTFIYISAKRYKEYLLQHDKSN